MHPTVRQSKFLDGTIPGLKHPRVFYSEEAMYIQPDIEVAEVGEGSEIKNSKTSICQRIDGDVNLGVADWLHANKRTIITALALYGGYRLLRRKQ